MVRFSNGVINNYVNRLARVVGKLYMWHPHPPFFYGWLVLGTAATGAFIAAGVAQTVLGGVQDLIAGDMGWDRKTIALAATLGTWVSGLTMPFIGKLVDRFGPRWMMTFAALFVGIGIVGLSGSQNALQFFFLYIAVRAIAGPNLQNLIPRTVAVNFFQRRRNLAIGITSLNRIFGESANIQIITAISNAYSWRVAYRSLGLIAIPLSLPIWLLMRHKPEDVGESQDGTSPEDTTDHSLSAKTLNGHWSVREILSLPSFWFILAGEFIAVSVTSMVIFQLVPYLVDGGVSQVAAAGALTLGNLLGGVSVPIWGWLTDKFTTKKIATLTMVCALAPSVLFTVTDSGTFGIPLVVIWTMVTGVIFVLGSMMLGSVFNRTSFGTATGLTGPSRTAAMGLGPTAGAYFVGWTGSYASIFLAAAIGYLFVILLYSSVRNEIPQ